MYLVVSNLNYSLLIFRSLIALIAMVQIIMYDTLGQIDVWNTCALS